MPTASIPFDPNLKDEDRGRGIIVVVVVFTSILTITQLMRVATKLCLHPRWGPDDSFALLAYMVNLAGSAFECVAVRGGFGRHLQFLADDEKRKYFLGSQMAMLMSIVAQCAARISLCYFILLLIKKSHKRLRWTAYILMGITYMSNGSTFVLWFLQAKPIDKLWNFDVPGTSASEAQLVDSMIMNTVSQSLIDVFYAISPLYFLRDVPMPCHKKLIIGMLTGCGLLTVAPGIARAVYVRDFLNPDSSWAYRGEFTSAIVERNLAGIVANLPMIPLCCHNVCLKARSMASHCLTGPERTTGARATGKNATEHWDEFQRDIEGGSQGQNDTEFAICSPHSLS